jgi:8-oxo-dGTP pyrophosphatase MutT (NUDIX family)
LTNFSTSNILTQSLHTGNIKPNFITLIFEIDKANTKMSRSLHFSENFVISCGTVTLDLQARKVLLILWCETGEYMLPKGRKNIKEALEATAIRETFEETGYRCELLPHTFPVLATPPMAGGTEGEREGGKDEGEGEGEGTSTEPFAVQQRVTEGGVLKIIYWYLAQEDSTALKTEGTQMAGEEFDSLWVEEGDVVRTLTFDADRKVVGRAMEGVWATSN